MSLIRRLRTVLWSDSPMRVAQLGIDVLDPWTHGLDQAFARLRRRSGGRNLNGFCPELKFATTGAGVRPGYAGGPDADAYLSSL
jgi:hypothetical protein